MWQASRKAYMELRGDSRCSGSWDTAGALTAAAYPDPKPNTNATKVVASNPRIHGFPPRRCPRDDGSVVGRTDTPDWRHRTGSGNLQRAWFHKPLERPRAPA